MPGFIRISKCKTFPDIIIPILFCQFINNLYSLPGSLCAFQYKPVQFRTVNNTFFTPQFSFSAKGCLTNCKLVFIYHRICCIYICICLFYLRYLACFYYVCIIRAFGSFRLKIYFRHVPFFMLFVRYNINPGPVGTAVA